MPVETLLKAMPEAVRASGRIDNYRPVVDGRALPCQPFEAAAVQLSAGVPLMTGWCENEQRLAYAPTPSIYKLSAREARASAARVLGVSQSDAASLIAVYRNGRPQDTPGDIFTQIFGDHRYRRSVTRAAELQIAHGGAPVYVYLLRWKSPVLDGLLRTPHTLCIAFAFGNVDLATGITGTGPDRYPLQEEMAQAWVAFARTGNPNHAGLPTWRPYSPAGRSTLVFDRKTRLVNDPLREERIAFEPYPRYVPAKGEGERTW
jgi:para-nitrobenzyl esterase